MCLGCNAVSLKKTRRRRFSPKTLFYSLIHLVSGANGEGYWHALEHVFAHEPIPAKSSLSKVRQKVSWCFFADHPRTLLSGFEPHRKTWNGLRVYAIDGQQLTLPRSKDLAEAGYNGRAVSKFRESYMSKGYLTHAYDVLSGVTKSLRFGPRLHEQNDSRGN